MDIMCFHLNKRGLVVLLILTWIFALSSCRRDEPELPSSGPTAFELSIPPFFPKPYLSPDNPLTVEGVKLGEKLYNDAILSSNGLSCSSCHQKDRSYSIPLFMDIGGNPISVPPHVNLAFNPNYNWNGSQLTLDTLCMGDFGPEFFNTNQDTLIRRLSQHSQYPQLFQEAFGINSFTELAYPQLQVKICYAISQYMRTLISADTRFDKYLKRTEKLSSMETIGMSIFFSEKGDCFHCHDAPLFTDNLFHNIGIDSVFVGKNQGRYQVTGNPSSLGLFSTPTLRNIEFTAPYMHDGRYETLEEVIEFYNSGVAYSTTLDPIMTKDGKQSGLHLSDYEKQCLIAFLHTLSDTHFVGK